MFFFDFMVFITAFYHKMKCRAGAPASGNLGSGLVSYMYVHDFCLTIRRENIFTVKFCTRAPLPGQSCSSFNFSCSFQKNVAKNRLAPYLRLVTRLGNPGSAPEYSSILQSGKKNIHVSPPVPFIKFPLNLCRSTSFN